MSNFRNFDRNTGFLLPPSVDEWLPEKHLARFVAEVIDSLDLSAMSNSYRGSGSASYHPKLLLAVLVYGYATGVFSSRKLERATYDSVAFRFIAANEHPDHDTIAISERLPLTINVRSALTWDVPYEGGTTIKLKRSSGLSVAPIVWAATRV